MRRIWRFFRDREWVAFVGVAAAIATEGAAVAEAISGDLEQAGDEFSPLRFVLVVAAVIVQRVGVWSRRRRDEEVTEALYTPAPSLPAVWSHGPAAATVADDLDDV